MDINIKCGNSLIGSDFYTCQNKIFTEEETLRINTFDWNKEFPFKFDAVIGNPPYAYRNATEDLLKPYYKDRYYCTQGNYDVYKFFIERSTSLLTNSGLLGFIVSATFLIQSTFEKLREVIRNTKTHKTSCIHSRRPHQRL